MSLCHHNSEKFLFIIIFSVIGNFLWKLYFSEHISYISTAHFIFSVYFFCIVGMQVEQQPTTQQEQMPHKQQPKQKKKLYGNCKILN